MTGRPPCGPGRPRGRPARARGRDGLHATRGFPSVLWSTVRRVLRPAAFLCLVPGLAPGSPAAQDLDELSLRLREHPVLAAMRHRSAGLRERATAAEALPDPVLSFGILNFPLADPSFSRYLPTSKAVGVRQMIPHHAVRAARAARARRGALHNDAAIEQRFAELRADLIVALIERARVATQSVLLAARDSKYDELEQAVEAEIKAGRPEVFRLAEIDVARADVARALADLDAEAGRIHARLTDLVGEVVDTLPPPQELRAWSGQADAFHAVRVARADVSVAEAGIDRAEAAWKPNWGLQFTYQQRDHPGDDWVSATATFTLPFWTERSQEPALREAEANRGAARSRVLAAARRAAARYRALDATRTAAESGITILEEKIGAIRDQTAARLTTYESGAGDYSPVLGGDIAVLQLQGQIAAERARRDRTVARMNALLVGP